MNVLYIYWNKTEQNEHDIHQTKNMRKNSGWSLGEISPPLVYLSWESDLWVIKIHWNSTSEHQCISSAKPVNSLMSDSFYIACMGHSVCQTDFSLSANSGYGVQHLACLLLTISLSTIHHFSSLNGGNKTYWNVSGRTKEQFLDL